MDGATATRERERFLEETRNFLEKRRKGTRSSSGNWGDGYELRHKLATTPALVTAFCRDSIALDHHAQGVEVVWALVGEVTRDQIVAHNAFLLPQAVERVDRAVVDLDRMQMIDDHVATSGWQVVGTCHTHTEFAPDGIRASNPDRGMWAKLLRTLNNGPHVHVIMGPSGYSERDGNEWLPTRYAAWITSEEACKVTIAPARLTVEGSPWD